MEKTVEQVAQEINKSVEDLKKSVTEKADLAVLESKFAVVTEKLDKLFDKDGKTIVPEFVAKQQAQLDDISTQLKQLGEYQSKNMKPVHLQLTEKIKAKDFQDQVKAMAGKKGAGINLEVTKAANIDTDDINSGTIETQLEVGVAAAPWRNTPIWDNINKGTIGQGRDSISWWELTTLTENAAMRTEQTKVSTGSAKTWTKQSMDIKFIQDFTKVSRSALEDFEYITSEVNDLMANGIPRKRETELLDGTGLTVYLKGITQYAKTFALPTGFNKLINPNEGDVLAAAILQCQLGNTSDTVKQGFMPNLILVDPACRVNMRVLKTAVEGFYQAHPMLAPDGNFFDSIRLVPCLDLDAGEFIVGDFSRAKAYMKRTMQVSFHYENEDDVLNDLVLVLASERIAGLKVSTPEAYAFVTGTFDAGKALIISTES